MRKLFTIILAVIMAVATEVTVMAQEKESAEVTDTQIFVAEQDGVPCLIEHVKGAFKEAVPPNSTIYFVIENAERAEDISGIRALTDDWDRGEEFTGTPRIEYRVVYDGLGQQSLGYRYVAALPVLELPGVTEAVISGKIAVGKRWTGSKKVKFSFSVKRDGKTVEPDSYNCDKRSYSINFDRNVGQVTIIFADLGRFQVDATAQGEVNIGFTTQGYTDIEGAYPDAQMRFLMWERNPIFNRVGKLFIYAEPSETVYEITSMGEVIPTQGEYSSENEAFITDTRRLGSYLISKAPLGKPVKPTPPVNPPTGATS